MDVRHWLIASGLAISFHVGAFYAVFYDGKAVEGSQGAGFQGIEFGLGMVGDLGVAEETTLAQEEVLEAKEPTEDVVETPPEIIEEPEPIEPEVIEPEIVEPEPIVEPEVADIPEPVEVKQESPVEIVVPEPTLKVEPKTEPVVEPDPIKEPEPKEKPVVQETVKPVAAASAANQKVTTGTGNTVSTGGNPGAKASYYTELSAVLAGNQRYPSASRRRNEEGIVHLSFVAYANGSVSDLKITKSSGYKRLDKAALATVKKSTPLPKFHEDMTETKLLINLPVAFSLNDRR